MWWLFLIAAWQFVSEKDGMQLQAQTLEGKPYQELQVITHTPLSLEQLDKFFATRFLAMTDKRATRTVIEQSPGRALFSDRVKIGVGHDRVTVVEIKRNFDEAHRTLEWRYDSIDHPIAAACEKCVHMDVRGAWIFTPSPSGGTDVRYLVYSDPAGDLPRGMVASGQRDAAFDRVRRLLREAAGGE
jgi:hypothetical protein